MPRSNRAILLTAPGTGAIAVVRLIGPHTTDFLAKHFSRTAEPSRCIHATLRDETGETIDDPVVFVSPDSSFADVNVHGGAWVVRATLELARRQGFEIVTQTSPPLPDDAVDAGEEIEREILTHLPLATTELAVRVLLWQGRAWRNLLDRMPVPAAEVRRILDDRSLDRLLRPPRVAIVGAPNVGKSTLANRLFAQERSITADMPGTTRDWIGEFANLDGLVVKLLDTPGIRETDDPLEREAIAHSVTQIETSDLLVLVLDATRLAVQEFPIYRARKPLIVVNKHDLAADKAFWDRFGFVMTVGTTGYGINELLYAIRARLRCDFIEPNVPRWWTQRQRDVLERALKDPSVLREITG